MCRNALWRGKESNSPSSVASQRTRTSHQIPNLDLFLNKDPLETITLEFGSLYACQKDDNMSQNRHGDPPPDQNCLCWRTYWCATIAMTPFSNMNLTSCALDTRTRHTPVTDTFSDVGNVRSSSEITMEKI